MCWNHVHVHSVFSIFWGDIVNNEGNVLCIRVERACVLVGMWQHVLIDMRACLVFVCLIFLLRCFVIFQTQEILRGHPKECICLHLHISPSNLITSCSSP
jgi:hypothetical protein